ncbi:hypothetical protein OS493_018401 [Desmophyllum pertusum]|uniref:Pre-mRNA-splicing regulator WTAP n=1 Tax=Desmophyllum pertusum TaxID=174260 RepID=A0A9X0A1W2_9CNID|nr:hypothetical protein OS493_018401 [Desmophyllum pertusum]
MRLATKEQEMHDLLTQIQDLKQAQNPSSIQLRSTLLDPAVNLLFQRMKTDLDSEKEKLEQAQNDLSAWKFTPDSVTGKKLMAKMPHVDPGESRARSSVISGTSSTTGS